MLRTVEPGFEVWNPSMVENMDACCFCCFRHPLFKLHRMVLVLKIHKQFSGKTRD